jgi:anti-sigma factor RsiW
MPNLDDSEKVPKRGWRCPPEESLAAFVDGHLGEQQRQALERHLADCAYCLKSVAGAIADMRHPAPATPAWLRQKAEAKAGQVKTKNWRWAWALAPALAGLFIAVVLLQTPRQKGHVVSTGASTLPAATAASPAEQTTRALPEATRSLRTGIEPLHLLSPASGSVLESNRLRFEWNATPGAASYKIRITTADGSLVWEARSEQPHAQAPPDLKIAPGSYFAWVTTYIDDGRELQSAPVSFRVQAGR